VKVYGLKEYATDYALTGATIRVKSVRNEVERAVA